MARKKVDIETEIFAEQEKLPVIPVSDAQDEPVAVPADEPTYTFTVPSQAEVDLANSVYEPQPVDAAIKTEIENRVRKPRKPRADAGKSRGASRHAREAEKDTSVELEQQEIEALAKTVSDMCVTVISGLADAYAERQRDEKWKLTAADRVNFHTAIKYVAKKNATLIAENPELYLFGVAILGYVAPRFAIPASNPELEKVQAEFMKAELPNPRD